MMKTFSLLSVFLVAAACSSKKPSESFDPQEVIDQSIAAHGADLTGRSVSFDFRDRKYTLLREKYKYTYARSWEDDSLGSVTDILVNSSEFTRTQNGDTVSLDEEWTGKYSRSVNSVLYFFQVPLVLNDKGAIKKSLGEVEIKKEPYVAIQITFTENGGGEDFEDVFIYWIHKEFKTIDYFAYSYLTDGGGARFREAINRRTVDGFVTQDYVNYEIEKGTSLETTPSQFESGSLKELSRIENVNVQFNGLKPTTSF